MKILNLKLFDELKAAGFVDNTPGGSYCWTSYAILYFDNIFIRAALEDKIAGIDVAEYVKGFRRYGLDEHTGSPIKEIYLSKGYLQALNESNPKEVKKDDAVKHISSTQWDGRVYVPRTSFIPKALVAQGKKNRR